MHMTSKGEDLVWLLKVTADLFLHSAARPPVPGRHYDFQVQVYNCLQAPMLHSTLLPYTYNKFCYRRGIIEPSMLIPAIFLLFELYLIWHIFSLE